MFFFMHPQPVGRRRAVAEMTVQARQAWPIAPGHVLEIAAPASPEPVPKPALPPAQDVSRGDHDTPI